MVHSLLSRKKASLLIPAVAFLGVIVVLALGYFFFSSSTPDGLANCVNVDRNAYGISPSVFSNLPPPPDCFETIASKYQDQSFTDAFFFSPEYYLQPEFFPSFKEGGLSYWQSPDAAHYGVVGFGSQPNSLRGNVIMGGTKTFRFFLNAGFGVRGYQAGRLDVSLSNPQDSKYVTVELDESSRTGFLLGPTFPRFSPLWVHVVDVTVSIAPNSPYKDYVFTLRSAKVSDDWFSSHNPPSATYYFHITDFVGSRPVFTLTVVPS